MSASHDPRSSSGTAADEPETEVRRVEVDDPHLSPHARDVLTHELQEAIGAEEVRVPKDASHGTEEVRDRVVASSPLFGRDRLLVAITFFGALATGGVISVAIAHWWVLLIAVGIHAAGTLAVGAVVIQMTTQPDAPDPTVTALLEEEGVHAPEKAFNDLLHEFSGAREGRGSSEVVASAGNERKETAGEDKAANQHEQQTAMTPTHGESSPAGSGSALVQYGVAGILVLFSIAVLFVNIDRGWIAPLVMIPVCVAWVLFHVLMQRRRIGRPAGAGDEASERRRLLRIAAGCWAGIEAVVLVAVLIAGTTS